MFAVCLMVAGALFVAIFFALVTNVIVSRRIEESLGRQKITGLRGHVLVIGLGTVGLEVASGWRGPAPKSWWWRWTSTTGTSARSAPWACRW